ncbi:MAG: hypothetical protein IE935_09100 [Micrococcales bacterium]|nr:hypothetical protein [Micrococcales bacterium]
MTRHDAQTPQTIGPGAADALAQLRLQSDPDALVMTNKHCRVGSLATGDCEPRWFAVAAFTERRVLVEGYSYDYGWGRNPLNYGAPFGDPALLAANDAFIADPDPTECRIFIDRGVSWVFADKRESWSPRLVDYGTVLVDNSEALVVELDPTCATSAETVAVGQRN